MSVTRTPHSPHFWNEYLRQALWNAQTEICHRICRGLLALHHPACVEARAALREFDEENGKIGGRIAQARSGR